ncbi:MAG: YbaB/EbfC family nucleoid-associated protein [Planctomycetaceae bacterium]|nr:YbaB/EbfC family nucleoid-associated protein [Phycisphaerales bacterium]MCE2653136.1 YbaB/EbfC family nucleoid-associated protein [Planctomycetaceae bacterium]
MFDQLKMMGAVANLMKNKEAIAEAAARVQENLEKRVVTVEAPDKSISVQVNGKLAVLEIRLADRVVKDAASNAETQAKMEKLIVGAVNAAMARAKEIIQEEISTETQKLGLGDLGGLSSLGNLLK